MTSLRQLLNEENFLILPGAFNAMSAKLIEATGFKAAYMGGYASAASLIARPDIGLLTQTEMVAHARAIASSIKIPLLCDADDGYGNYRNVMRTVAEYERAGVAGIHIEDQVAPKRCGHLEGKEVVPKKEMVQKLKAALDARKNPDFFIIARTDARAVHGFDDAMDRAFSYAEQGVDAIFVEAPRTLEEIKTIGRSFKVPAVFNWTRSGKTPLLPANEIAGLGFKIILFPLECLFAAHKAVRDVLCEINGRGTTEDLLHRMTSFSEFNEFVGLSDYLSLDKRYLKIG